MLILERRWWTKRPALIFFYAVAVFIFNVVIFLTIISHAHAAPSCDRMVAEDTKALLSASSKLHKACSGDDMHDRCTRAIEAGDKAIKASDHVAEICHLPTRKPEPNTQVP